MSEHPVPITAEGLVKLEKELDELKRVRQQAMDGATEVKRWGEQVILPPMNHRQRQEVFQVLASDTEIITADGEEVRPGFQRMVISLATKK